MSDAIDNTENKDRPFPWRCPRCRKKSVWRTTVPYDCKRQHAGQSIAVHLDALAVPKCSECGELIFDYVAEQQINDAFVAMFARGTRHGDSCDANATCVVLACFV